MARVDGMTTTSAKHEGRTMDEADHIKRLTDIIIDAVQAYTIENKLDWDVAMKAGISLVVSILVSIDCTDCRDKAEDYLRKGLPEFIDRVMAEAAREPVQSRHVH